MHAVFKTVEVPLIQISYEQICSRKRRVAKSHEAIYIVRRGNTYSTAGPIPDVAFLTVFLFSPHCDFLKT